MPHTFRVQGLHVDHAAPPPEAAPPGRPPVLLVHGAGHGAWCWAHWLAVLPHRGWAACALSLRGHPGSDPVDEETFLHGLRVDDYADDVAAVAGHIGAPAVVIGHSMGGIVAQRFAERAARGSWPGVAAPAGMVLLASVVPGQLGPMRATPIDRHRPYRPEREHARRLYFRGANRIVENALDHLTAESPSVINEYSLGDGVPIEPGLVRCPVLVVTAAFDRTNVPRDRRVADFYGGDYRYEEIGHDLMLDVGWEHVLDGVADWLEDRVARASRAGS